MNDDRFEKELHALSAALRRSDPTLAWKADILARARREATANLPARSLPPRWLMVTWAAAWIAILAMKLTAPPEMSLRISRAPADSPAQATAETLPRGESATLLAFQQHLHPNLDIP